MRLSIFFIFFILFSLFSASSGAIGLRGFLLKDEFIFEPGITKTYEYYLVTHSETQDYELYTSMRYGANLTQYVTLSNTLLKQIPPGSSVPFSATLSLPDTLDYPGWHEIRVGVRETSIGGGNVGAFAGSEGRIIILVLYPYKYLEAKLNASNINVNGSSSFSVKLNNYGSKDIGFIYGDLEVYDNSNNLIKNIRTKIIPLASKKESILDVVFDATNLSPGIYKVKGTIFYDENETKVETQFRIGELDVKLLDYKKRVYTNVIDKFYLNLASEWNGDIYDAYAIISVFNETKTFIINQRTPNTDLTPFGVSKLEMFLDFVNVFPGNYSLKMNLFYNGKNKDILLPIEVVNPPIVEVDKPSFADYLKENIILVMVVGINVILILIVVILLLGRKEKK